MNKLIKSAFTLIELLVVIAIIGILSGLIVVSMGGMTTKANIAKTQVFSNSLRNSLIADIAGEWKMDEGSGQVTADSWGGLNNCTLGSTTSVEAIDPTWITTGCIYSNCLSFDGGDSMDCGNNNSLNITGSVTISAWVNTNFNGTYQVVASKSGWGISSNQYVLTVHNGEARFSATNGTNEFNAIKSGVTPTQWHYLVGTYDESTKVFKVFVDGIIGNNATLTGTKSTTVQNFSIGAARVSSPIGFFPGLIDDVRVYDAVAPISQIKEQYYAGLNGLLISGQITKEEYSNRISILAISPLD